MAQTLGQGTELERATAFIHENLLKNDPNFKTVEYSIETRKTIKVREVPYEVDVLVTTAPQSLYQQTVIFECKDWRRPVDKSQIVLLDDKVNALCANRGYLVARSITKGAKALLEQKGRLGFIQCNDDFASPVDGIEFVHIFHEFWPMCMVITKRDAAPDEVSEVWDPENIECFLTGRRITMIPYIDSLIRDFVEEDRKNRASEYRFEGTHYGERGLEVTYYPGELIINGRDIEKIGLPLRYWVEVCRQKVISKFELNGRGRAFFFEPLKDSVTGNEYTIEIVQCFAQGARKRNPDAS